jgi:predicted transcriptional regulator
MIKNNDGDIRKVITIAAMYSSTDQSIESIASQLHLDVKEVKKVVDELSQIDDALKSVINQEATPIENIMIRDVACLDAYSATALEAASVMAEREIGSVIVTKQDVPYGIVTERDIVRRAGAKDEYFRDVVLQDIASHPLIVSEPQVTINKATEIMTKNRIRRLPIISNEKLLGIVTIRDLAKFLSSSTRRQGFALSILKAISRI